MMMKRAIFAVFSLVFASIIWWFGIRDSGQHASDSEEEKPGEASVLAEHEQKREGAAGGDSRIDSDARLRTITSDEGSRIVDDLAETFADFAREMQFSETEYEEFLNVIREINRRRIAVLRGTQNPSRDPSAPAPSRDELAKIREDQDRQLLEALGKSGVDKYKAYSGTYNMRRVINNLGWEVENSVLYGAYNDAVSGGPSSSLYEYSTKLTAAVLERSSRNLSAGELIELETALENDYLAPIREREPRRRPRGERPRGTSASIP